MPQQKTVWSGIEVTEGLSWPEPEAWDVPLLLPPAGVDCWAVLLPAPPAAAKRAIETLSREERERADRFRLDYQYNAYVASHAALRVLLGCYVGCPPKSVEILVDNRNRPFLGGAFSRLQFNLSHSDDTALVAVASDRPVGVDVEKLRALPNWLPLAHHYFAQREVENLNHLSHEQGQFSFFVTWTRKEAFVKALGLGLFCPLDAFCTGQPHFPAKLTWRDGEAADWTLADLSPRAGVVGAIAVRRPQAYIRCRQAPWPWLMRPVP